LPRFTQVFAPPRSRNSARLIIIVVVCAILVPALLGAGWLASLSAASERAQLEQGARNQAREVAAAISREIANAGNLLLVLADSHELRTGDLEGFHRRVSTIAQTLNTQIVLTDKRRRMQVVNTALPWGEPIVDRVASLLTEADEKVLASGRSVVSRVFYGPIVKRHLVAVFMPIVGDDGQLDFALSVAIPLDRFAGILDSFSIEPDHVVTVVDQRNTIIARSQDNGSYAATQIQAIVRPPKDGFGRSLNRQGVAFHWYHRELERFGWLVAIGIPERVFEAPSRLAIGSFASAGSLLLVLAVAVAYGWGGRIGQSIGALGIDRKPTREEFEILFNSAPNGVMVADQEGTILLSNTRMEAKFGYGPGELIGQPVEILVPERFRGTHMQLRGRFMRAPEGRAMGAGRDLYGRRRDGSEFPVEIGLSPINPGAGNLVMVTVVDITARMLAQEKLAATAAERDALRRSFLQAQEHERLRLAHELHDQTGQSLTAVMLELKSIENAADPSSRARLRLLRLQLEQMGRTLHDVAWELRPPSIDELGLTSALANYVSEWGAKSNLESDFHCGDLGLDQLSEEIRTTVYRVVQEALTNVAKHARNATRISVVIERVRDELRLTIEDDGAGFDASPSMVHDRPRGGLGLAGMRERLTLIGGQLEVESSANAGTTVFARIPLPRESLLA
jgi:PAS domain S-box-containing protein